MPTRYSLTIKNNNNISGDFCLYQVDPNAKDRYIKSLAWFSEKAQPNTTLTFEWSNDYSFVWANAHSLVYRDDVFNPSQEIDARGNNYITFTQKGKIHQFVNLKTREFFKGSLHINCDSTVISKKAFIGIAMSGSPTFVRISEPFMALSLSTKIEYRLAFGHFTQGTVLDIHRINDFAAKIKFPPNVYNMTATLNLDDTWTVEPS